jgi:hypothetical protein
MRRLIQFAAPASWMNRAGRISLACAIAFLAAGSLQATVPLPAAQSTVEQPAHPSALKTQHTHKRLPAKTPLQTVAVPVVTVAPPEPEAPHWPANDQPTPATVTWDSHGLLVEAANSSLAQILHDVSTATGTTVDGFAADQRIFGSYGPGPPRDILVQILQGSGYNILMVGDQGQGTPRQILLSSRNAASSPSPNRPGANSDEDDADAEEPAPQPVLQPEQQRPNGVPARTPQQIMQEMQQRQQQMGQRGGFPQNTPPAPPQ